MIQRFCDADGVLSVSLAFVENAPLNEGARQEGPGQDRGGLHEAESVTDVIALQELHQPSAGIFGPPIVARQVVDVDTVVLGYDLERLIAERLPNSLHSLEG